MIVGFLCYSSSLENGWKMYRLGNVHGMVFDGLDCYGLLAGIVKLMGLWTRLVYQLNFALLWKLA